jgi:thiol-disulfide isomerase/thioredoxin
MTQSINPDVSSIEENSKQTPPPDEVGVSPKRRIPAAAFLFGGMLLFSLVTAVMILQNPAPSQPVRAGTVLATASSSNILNRPAPAIEMRDLKGDVVELTDYAGKTVFLNFWWSGCQPCIEELPDLEAFAQAQAANDVVVVTVNNVDTPEQIEAFLDKNEITLNTVHILRDVKETSYSATRLLNVLFFPTTYVIDEAQNVKNVKFGMLTTKEMDSFLAEVRQSTS